MNASSDKNMKTLKMTYLTYKTIRNETVFFLERFFNSINTFFVIWIDPENPFHKTYTDITLHVSIVLWGPFINRFLFSSGKNPIQNVVRLEK